MKLSRLLYIATILILGDPSISYADDNDFLIRTSVDMKYAFCDINSANRKFVGFYSPIFSLINGKFIPVI